MSVKQGGIKYHFLSLWYDATWDWTQVSRIIRKNRLIGRAGKVFASGPRDRDLISGRVIPKTLKMVLDATLLNTQYYKVGIKSKVEQYRERSSALLLHLGVVAIEKGAFGSPSTKVANFTNYIYNDIYWNMTKYSSKTIKSFLFLFY